MIQTSLSTPAVEKLQQAAKVLLEARRTGTALQDLPAELIPANQDEAYYLQDILAEAYGPIGGWKVGAGSPDVIPAYGPMPLALGFRPSGAAFTESFRHYRAVEAEIGFLLGKDLPARSEPYTRDEVLDAIASAHPVIEVLESAFVDPDKATKQAAFGDLQMNGGFVWGNAVPDWEKISIPDEGVQVLVDGKVEVERRGSNKAGPDLIRLVLFVVNKGGARTGGLKAGQWITTGSWTGKTPTHAGAKAVVRFEHFGSVELSF